MEWSPIRPPEYVRVENLKKDNKKSVSIEDNDWQGNNWVDVYLRLYRNFF